MLELVVRLKDKDGTDKLVFKDNNGIIEITKINTKPDRDIFCIPSMYGCNLGCTFCFLTTHKIDNISKKIEYQTIVQCLEFFQDRKDRRQISIMGAGDPSLNLDLVLECCKNEELVSIASIFPKILPKLPKNLKIHFSLHSPIQQQRNKIIPAGKAKIDDIFEYLQKHEGKTEIHYTLIKNVNDSDDELFELLSLLEKYKINIKFLDFKESKDMVKSDKLDLWLKLTGEKVISESYYPPGERVQGSCGMFTKGFYNEKYKNSKEHLNYLEENKT